MLSLEVLRIIDANFNRAKEALRVLEDIARFTLFDKELSSSFRSYKHLLDGFVKGYYLNMVEARVSRQDPGSTFYCETTKNLQEIAISNIQRLQEALRSLEEVFKLFSIKNSNECMKLRFKVYECAKKLLSLLEKEKVPKILLYLIGGAEDWFKNNRYNQVLSKDLFMIQYREKNLPLSISCEHVLKLVNKAQKVGVKVIINDRVDLCAAMDADGVHIGKEDLPVGYCRKLLGIKKYIGFTTHSVEELVKASKDPQIDYVSFGTIFASQTKTSRPFYGEQILSKLKDLKLVEPPILIGGINEKNVDIVIKYGFKRIAVSAGIFSVENPRRAVERILNKLYK